MEPVGCVCIVSFVFILLWLVMKHIHFLPVFSTKPGCCDEASTTAHYLSILGPCNLIITMLDFSISVVFDQSNVSM